ncbi:MAG: VOC family protein [Anaerolineae bacterium]
MGSASASKLVPTTLAPWLAVRDGACAVAFYVAAFGAAEVYHIEGPDGAVVSRLRIGESEFWLSDESPEHGNYSPQTLGGSTVRLILTVSDPDALYARTVAAGATPVAPVTEEHGWRSGRLRDPYGHEWEIGRLLGR